MIAIVNKSKNYGKGLQTYDIFINKKKITSFTHKFEDGLGICLKKASEAVQEEDHKDKKRKFAVEYYLDEIWNII